MRNFSYFTSQTPVKVHQREIQGGNTMEQTGSQTDDSVKNEQY